MTRAPFILLDDARTDGAADARLYEAPQELFVAYRPDQVMPVLDAAQEALRSKGGTLAGSLAYEAGHALEERLMPLAAPRTGANGPLVWLGRFDGCRTVPAGEVPDLLAVLSDTGQPAPGIGPLEPAISQGAHGLMVERLREAITAGDIYQANLTFPLEGSYQGDPAALYAALRPVAQAGYGALVFDGSHWLLSFSPELFVSIKDGQVRARPMKGTRPRGIDAAQDAALREELASSEKDRAENLMIVDLMRNDLSRIAAEGSVRVERPFTVETYPTVHQMVTDVEARLKPGTAPLDVIRALFPCGSITGAPKLRAQELIAEVEPFARGPYCGAIGRWEANGDMVWNVAIRTLRLTPVENGRGTAVLGVGSAILTDSDADAEWRECLVKGAFARASSPEWRAARFDLIETMRFGGSGRIDLLDLHLQRLAASGKVLGAAVDVHHLRNLIQAACFRLDRPTCVRLAVSRAGAVALSAQPLPPAWPEPARCIVLPRPVDGGDWRLRHKTSDRGFYEDARAAAEDAGAEETLFVTPEGEITEGAITSVFVAGENGVLTTPPLSLGLLPGVLRRSLIEQGRAREGRVTPDDLTGGFFLGNALRGLVPARLADT